MGHGHEGDAQSAQHAPQPRWYNRDAQELTPLGQLLVEWMREQQIVAQSELARRIGVKQQSVSDYLKPAAEARIPRPRVLQRISRASGIPLATLYLAAGVPLYTDPDELPPPPPPRRSQMPARRADIGDPPDMWQEFYRRIAAFNLPLETRDAIINLAEDVQRGYPPHERARIAEHTIIEAEPPQHQARQDTPGAALRSGALDDDPV